MTAGAQELRGPRLADRTLEWLEADGLGGFASGTACGERTRRYHGLLLTATTPPTGRVLLVSGLEVQVELAGTAQALSVQRYDGDVVHPDGLARLESFGAHPWPTWRWTLPDGSTVEHELLAPKGDGRVVLCWRRRGGSGPARLRIRPLLCGRDPHALHHENPDFRFDTDASADGAQTWRPYAGLPAVVARSNGLWRQEPQWYRRFLYTAERERGLDAVEDLASPGEWTHELDTGEALLVLGARPEAHGAPGGPADLGAWVAATREAERVRRAGFASPLERAADQYQVVRGDGLSLVAGYPWFGDWGRDTFIAVRGLCLATGRLDAARDVLLAWADAVSQGMLPNRFPDSGERPEYNSVDASLWYVVAAGEFLEACDAHGFPLAPARRRALHAAITAILDGHIAGTRYGIHADTDGLLAAGEPGWQLTWMDARADGREITPRIGKPVEVQALWAAALAVGARLRPRFGDRLERVRRAFPERFWNDDLGHLNDVVDCDHVPGCVDPTLRPNQVLAVGGLPLRLLSGLAARRVVDVVESRLWTPLGLRSLAPGEPGYAPRYVGGPSERDARYHQGTVWPWLVGPFVEAWLHVHGDTPGARQVAHERFLAPLLAHLDEAGLGHVSEIADAESPHTPRGCPFQAWSLGELLRLRRVVLAPAASRPAALVGN